MKYWYLDNWTGQKKKFKLMREAVAAAEKEYGNVIYIHKYNSSLVRVVAASGFTPA